MNDWPTSLAAARKQILALRDELKAAEEVILERNVEIDRMKQDIDFWRQLADRYRMRLDQ
jgi:hypothetical protein